MCIFQVKTHFDVRGRELYIYMYLTQKSSIVTYIVTSHWLYEQHSLYCTGQLLCQVLFWGKKPQHVSMSNPNWVTGVNFSAFPTKFSLFLDFSIISEFCKCNLVKKKPCAVWKCLALVRILLQWQHLFYIFQYSIYFVFLHCVLQYIYI